MIFTADGVEGEHVFVMLNNMLCLANSMNSFAKGRASRRHPCGTCQPVSCQPVYPSGRVNIETFQLKLTHITICIAANKADDDTDLSNPWYLAIQYY